MTAGKFTKLVSLILSLLIVWQGVVWADPAVFQKNTVQPYTLFTGPAAEDAFFNLVSGYLGRFLTKIENDNRSRNIFRVRYLVNKELRKLKDSEAISDEFKETIPDEVEFDPLKAAIIINLGQYKIRYFNHNIKGISGSEILYRVDPGNSYVVVKAKVGPYLSRQIITQDTLTILSDVSGTRTETSPERERSVSKLSEVADTLETTLSQEKKKVKGRSEHTMEDGPASGPADTRDTVITRLYSGLSGFLRRILTVQYSVNDITDYLERYGWVIPEDSREDIVNTWKSTIALYPPQAYSVAQHSIRTALLAILIYSRLDSKKEKTFQDINSLISAALAHDLGKRDRELVPLVLKEGRLKKEEKEKIRTHINRSIEIPKKAGIAVDETAKAAIREHLPGYEGAIPCSVVSRIVYIADQIDACQDMSRPYRRREMKSWDGAKGLKSLHTPLAKEWIHGSEYDAVKGLIEGKNEDYFRVVISTYYLWQRWVLWFHIRYRFRPVTPVPFIDMKMSDPSSISSDEAERSPEISSAGSRRMLGFWGMLGFGFGTGALLNGSLFMGIMAISSFGLAGLFLFQTELLKKMEGLIKSQPIRAGPTDKLAYFHRQANRIKIHPFIVEEFSKITLYSMILPHEVVHSVNYRIFRRFDGFFLKRIKTPVVMRIIRKTADLLDDLLAYTIGILPPVSLICAAVLPYLIEDPRIKRLKFESRIEKYPRDMIEKFRQLEELTEKEIGRIEIDTIAEVFGADTYKYSLDKQTKKLSFVISTKDMIRGSSYIEPRPAEDKDEKEMVCSIAGEYFASQTTLAEKRAILVGLLEEQAEYEKSGRCGWQWVIDRDERGNILIDEFHGLRGLHIRDREKLPNGYFLPNIEEDSRDYGCRDNVKEMFFGLADRPEKVDVVLVINWPQNKRQGYCSFLADGYIDLVSRTLYQIKNRTNIEISLLRKKKELEDLAKKDGLTGAYNHRYFQKELIIESDRSERYGQDLSLLMIDIDFFKKFNDEYGHPAGDEVLKKVVQSIGGELRQIDTVARYGGEEFAVILPVTNLEGAGAVAERIRKAIENTKVRVEDVDLNVTVSIGVAAVHGIRGVQLTRKDLIRRADRSLYISKEAGRNRVTLWEERVASAKITAQPERSTMKAPGSPSMDEDRRVDKEYITGLISKAAERTGDAGIREAADHINIHAPPFRNAKVDPEKIRDLLKFYAESPMTAEEILELFGLGEYGYTKDDLYNGNDGILDKMATETRLEYFIHKDIRETEEGCESVFQVIKGLRDKKDIVRLRKQAAKNLLSYYNRHLKRGKFFGKFTEFRMPNLKVPEREFVLVDRSPSDDRLDFSIHRDSIKVEDSVEATIEEGVLNVCSVLTNSGKKYGSGRGSSVMYFYSKLASEKGLSMGMDIAINPMVIHLLYKYVRDIQGYYQLGRKRKYIAGMTEEAVLELVKDGHAFFNVTGTPKTDEEIAEYMAMKGIDLKGEEDPFDDSLSAGDMLANFNDQLKVVRDGGKIRIAGKSEKETLSLLEKWEMLYDLRGTPKTDEEIVDYMVRGSALVLERPPAQENRIGEKIIENARHVIPWLVHAMTDVAENVSAKEKKEKVILFLDEDLAGLNEKKVAKKIKKLMGQLTGVKKNNDDLLSFLRDKLEISSGTGEEFSSKRGTVKDENIIVVTKKSNLEYFTDIEGSAVIAAIDDRDFPRNAYLPLLEVVLLAIGKYLEWDENMMREHYKNIPNIVSIENLEEEDHKKLFDSGIKNMVIRLIPDAVEFDTEELVEMMVIIRGILRKA